MTTRLRESVLEFAGQATPETLEKLASEVASVGAADAGLPGRIGARFADPHIRHGVVQLLTRWIASEAFDARLLAECLFSVAAATRWRDAHERLELVWSGPHSGGSLRRSDEALLQVVRTAERQLSLVTFAAYRIESVAVALREAIARRIVVRFFGETEAGSEGRLSRDAAAALGPSLASRIEVYEWPLDARPVDTAGRRGVLHAKFALADEQMLFVSSANLTEAALDANMELGVLVSGGSAPITARAHLDRLIAEGVLRRSIANG